MTPPPKAFRSRLTTFQGAWRISASSKSAETHLEDALLAASKNSPSSFRLHLSLLMCSSRESQIIRLNVHVLWDSPNWIDDDVSALISGQSEGSCPCYVSSWLSWTVLLIVINIFSFIISIIDFLLLSSFHFQYCCYCITTSSSITAATSLLLLLLPILLLLLLFLILPLLILLLLLLLLLLLHYHYYFF